MSFPSSDSFSTETADGWGQKEPSAPWPDDPVFPQGSSESEGAKTSAQRCVCTKRKRGRNLVVCIDGTSNKVGMNVSDGSYVHVIKSETQLTYYNSGIGAHTTPLRNRLNRYFRQATSTVDLVMAWSLERGISDAYRWLSDNYRDGDKIFLFGFSRGAYQVRALAGMIREARSSFQNALLTLNIDSMMQVGLILPGNTVQIPYAYQVYQAINSGTETSRELARHFKITCSRPNVMVHFIGVWDTVSSVGFIRGKTLPSTTGSIDHFCQFRHALALDERRVKFMPEYINGGKSDTKHDYIQEMWFPGCHSDVDMPLLWMRAEAETAGLNFDQWNDITFKQSDLEAQGRTSLHGPWWLLEFLPIRRMHNNNANGHARW
ncbi:hypothetical protein HYDPIDRAFT_97688 [Hydnomerulius pinastri MD-312]|uniref:T6SS Phospholipase effector Tle1-like catalytic domain-containing protein n=1 Tax=Hydnomerulius pinastri MD-312 TaxID=994086 RepID=A0A0C9WB60_9AGAM|nr:hypothetical protein HYDPIDRAFT_97688 [Hydnomerulius pinastri MD-312]